MKKLYKILFLTLLSVVFSFALASCGDETTPAVSTPLETTPAVSTPVVSTPAVSTPVVSTPAVSTPVVSTPAVSTPVATTPTVSTPVVSTPAVSTPVVSTTIVTTTTPLVHEHELEWVTIEEPSFITLGKKVGTCACGYEETVEIPALVNNQEKDEFLSNFLKSFDSNYTIKLNDLSVAVGDDTQILICSEAYSKLDEDGDLVVYGVALTEVNHGFMSNYGEVQFVIQDGYLYVTISPEDFILNPDYNNFIDTHAIFEFEESCIMIPTDEIFVQMNPMSFAFVDFEEMFETFFATIETAMDELDEFVDEYVGEIDPYVYEYFTNIIARSILDGMFVCEEGTDDFTYIYNYQNLVELNSILESNTISQLVDMLVGEGAFANLNILVDDIYTLTFEELNNILQQNELDLNQIISLLDVILVEFVSPEASLKSFFEGATNEEIEDLVKFLSESAFKDEVVLDFIGEQIGVDFTLYKEDITNVLTILDQTSVYAVVGQLLNVISAGMIPADIGMSFMTDEGEVMPSQLSMLLESVIGLLSQSDISHFVTDKEGNVEELYLGFLFGDLTSDGTPFNLDLSVYFDDVEPFDTSEVVNAVTEVVSMVKINKDTEILWDGIDYYDYEFYDAIFDENDEFVRFDYKNVLINYSVSSEAEDSISLYVEIEEHSYEYEFEFTGEFSKSCTNSVVVQPLSTTDSFEANLYEGTIEMDPQKFAELYEANLIEEYLYSLIDTDCYVNKSYDSISGGGSTFTFVFDCDSNSLEFGYPDMEDYHNLKLNEDESFIPEEETCGSISFYVYECEDCDYMLIEITANAHLGPITQCADLVNNCVDGVTIRTHCDACGLDEYETIYYHMSFEHDILESFDVCDDHHIIEDNCACLMNDVMPQFELFADGIVIEETTTSTTIKCPDCELYISSIIEGEKTIIKIYFGGTTDEYLIRLYTNL